jgi:hypothetical protein
VDTTDRVVLVAAGFGVWQAGRHVASTRWTDVVRVHATGRDAGTTDPVSLVVRLRNGTEFSVSASLAGFEPFLLAAETRLLGMRQRVEWLAGMEPSPAAQPAMVLFERYATPG